MTLLRGDVVKRGRATGIVWDPRPESFSILPVARTEFGRRADVPIIDLPDRLAVQATGDLVIQAGRILRVSVVGQERIGALSGPLMCRVVQAIVREEADRRTVARWAPERRRRIREAASC